MRIGPYYITEWLAGIGVVTLMMTACALLLRSTEFPDIWEVVAFLGCLVAAVCLLELFVPPDSHRGG